MSKCSRGSNSSLEAIDHILGWGLVVTWAPEHKWTDKKALEECELEGSGDNRERGSSLIPWNKIRRPTEWSLVPVSGRKAKQAEVRNTKGSREGNKGARSHPSPAGHKEWVLWDRPRYEVRCTSTPWFWATHYGTGPSGSGVCMFLSHFHSSPPSGCAKSSCYIHMITLLTTRQENVARTVNSKSEVLKVQVWASGGHIYPKAPFRAPWSYTVVRSNGKRSFAFYAHSLTSAHRNKEFWLYVVINL